MSYVGSLVSKNHEGTDPNPALQFLTARFYNARGYCIYYTLAEMKARKIAEKNIGTLVLGCDQVLSFKGSILCKPETAKDACNQLRMLRGETHQLLSAAVIYEGTDPVWRHVGVAKLTMRDFSNDYLDTYVDRNWDSISSSVGSYKIEEEGIRLFRMVQGDTFTIQGLPLLELLSYLTLRGTLPT